MTSSGKSRLLADPVLRLSSLPTIRDAVRAGVGAARLPISLVSRDIAAGRLVRWADVDGPDMVGCLTQGSCRITLFWSKAGASEK